MRLSGLLSAAEIILNRFLRLDPESKNSLNRLSGKVVRVELNTWSHYWLLTSDAIRLVTDYDGSCDLVLRGSLFDFMRLGLIKKEASLTAVPIQIAGDMEFAKQFQDLFASLAIDWEEQLSRVVGDTIAYPLAQFFTALRHWATQSVDSMGQNITEYLQFEMDCLVSAEELQNFFADIDDLRDDAARLQARVDRWHRQWCG